MSWGWGGLGDNGTLCNLELSGFVIMTLTLECGSGDQTIGPATWASLGRGKGDICGQPLTSAFRQPIRYSGASSHVQPTC